MEKVKSKNTRVLLIKKSNQQKIKDYITYFFIYAIIGWVLETIYAIICGNPEKRGFLYGPLCPIYGFGAIAIILLLNNKKIKSKFTYVKQFFTIAVVLTIAEYIVSFIAEALFQIKLWDYTTEPLQIGGRICLSFSLLWGIGGMVFYHFIHPFMKQYAFKTTKKVQNVFLIITISIFMIDIILSVVKYIL